MGGGGHGNGAVLSMRWWKRGDMLQEMRTPGLEKGDAFLVPGEGGERGGNGRVPGAKEGGVGLVTSGPAWGGYKGQCAGGGDEMYCKPSWVLRAFGLGNCNFLSR